MAPKTSLWLLTLPGSRKAQECLKPAGPQTLGVHHARVHAASPGLQLSEKCQGRAHR